MILQLEDQANVIDIERLIEKLNLMGFHAVTSHEGNTKSIAILNGVDRHTQADLFDALPFVKKVQAFTNKFKLVGKDVKQSKTVIRIKDKTIGAGDFTIMAGPCTIESREQLFAIAERVSQDGATILRGGAFKPRTSPYDFQGLGEEGLKIMRDAANTYNMLSVSEVMSPEDVPLIAQYIDILQIGARNMQNFNLLKAVGKSGVPVLLKRGLNATYNEFLLAAEYIMSCGNPNVILCERGIRTFETYSRNTLDIAAVPILQHLTHLPIIVDPSHATGLRHVIAPVSNAAIAIKADGLMVEVHTDPDKSVSDAAQAISPDMFAEMIVSLRRIGTAVGLIV